MILLGARHQTPWVGFAESSAKQNNAFASFSGKRILFNSLQGGLRRVFCEAEERFLLLFLEKEEYYSTNSLQDRFCGSILR
jgi:hypothetical protein